MAGSSLKLAVKFAAGCPTTRNIPPYSDNQCIVQWLRAVHRTLNVSSSVTMPVSHPCPASQCCGLSSRSWKARSLVFLIHICRSGRYIQLGTKKGCYSTLCSQRQCDKFLQAALQCYKVRCLLPHDEIEWLHDANYREAHQAFNINTQARILLLYHPCSCTC